MPVFNIHHITQYKYDRPVKESVNEIRIYPFADGNIEILFHHVEVSHHPTLLQMMDYWGNRTGMFNLMSAHKELTIESKVTVRTLGNDIIELDRTLTFDELRKECANDLKLLELSQPTEWQLKDKINAVIDEIQHPDDDVATFVEKCSQYIYNEFKYIKGITTIETTVDEILGHRSGVCQDFAHVLLEVLRSRSIPSRYVSGYICPNKNGMRGEGATHAWIEVWLLGNGWVGIDPTNNVWVTTHHIRLAIGRNFSDCSPIKGTFKGPAKQSLSVFVAVGYEDGNTFQEVNDVKMVDADSSDEIPEYNENQAGQQQQQ